MFCQGPVQVLLQDVMPACTSHVLTGPRQVLHMLAQVMFCQVSTSDLQGWEHPGCCVRCNMTPVVAWLPRDNTNVGHHVITSTRKQSTST